MLSILEVVAYGHTVRLLVSIRGAIRELAEVWKNRRLGGVKAALHGPIGPPDPVPPSLGLSVCRLLSADLQRPLAGSNRSQFAAAGRRGEGPTRRRDGGWRC